MKFIKILIFILSFQFFGGSLLLAKDPVVTALPASTQLEDVFDQKKEFPNYFLPEKYRDMPASAVPQKAVDQSRHQVEKALASIFSRLQLSIVEDFEKKELKQVRFFEYLREHVKKIDPGVQILPSGGVVRSALSYIYAEVIEAKKSSNPRSAEKVLEDIANETSPIEGSKIRGVGSDFDILTRAGEPSKSKDVNFAIKKITNSAAEVFNARSIQGKQAETSHLFTFGDIKDYDTQITRSVNQGGATIDLLAFDMKKGSLITPKPYPFVVDDMLRGQYRYLPAPMGAVKEAADATTIRGIRALVELPWMQVNDPRLLNEELKKLSGAKTIDKKAAEQIEKLIRNARFSGANNRIFRGAPGTPEHAFYEFTQQHPSVEIREWTKYEPLENRSAVSRGLNGLPEELLMPVDTFIKKFTKNGKLFHGTRSVQNALAIMRGGFFISGGKNNQGGYVYGPGTYSTADMSVAQGYGQQGVVLELKIRPDSRLNVINWPDVENKPYIKNLVSAYGRDRAMEILKDKHSIDIIVNHHVLIQNVEAVQKDKDFGNLLRGLAGNITNPHIDARTRLYSLDSYQVYSSFGRALGVSAKEIDLKDLKFNTEDIKELAKLILNHDEAALRYAEATKYSDLELLRATAISKPHRVSDILLKPENFQKPEIFNIILDVTKAGQGDFVNLLSAPEYMSRSEVIESIGEGLQKNGNGASILLKPENILRPRVLEYLGKASLGSSGYSYFINDSFNEKSFKEFLVKNIDNPNVFQFIEQRAYDTSEGFYPDLLARSEKNGRPGAMDALKRLAAHGNYEARRYLARAENVMKPGVLNTILSGNKSKEYFVFSEEAFKILTEHLDNPDAFQAVKAMALGGDYSSREKSLRVLVQPGLLEKKEVLEILSIASQHYQNGWLYEVLLTRPDKLAEPGALEELQKRSDFFNRHRFKNLALNSAIDYMNNNLDKPEVIGFLESHNFNADLERDFLRVFLKPENLAKPKVLALTLKWASRYKALEYLHTDKMNPRIAMIIEKAKTQTTTEKTKNYLTKNLQKLHLELSRKTSLPGRTRQFVDACGRKLSGVLESLIN